MTAWPGLTPIRADAGRFHACQYRRGFGALIRENGGTILEEGSGWFTRQDDRTFVLGLNYPLFLYEEEGDPLSGETVSLQLHGLVACNVEVLEEETHEWGGSYQHLAYHDETPLAGDYTLTFTIPEPGTEGIRRFTGPEEENGVTLHSLTATPAAAKLDIQLPAEGNIQPSLTTEDGTSAQTETGRRGSMWMKMTATAITAGLTTLTRCRRTAAMLR